MALTTEKIQQKSLVLGIVGLGYVGYPLALTFAESGVKTIGFDIDLTKIEKINQGESYIQHVNHGRLQHVQAHHQFTATADFMKIQECDAILICVPTPLNEHLEPDLSFITKTCEAIGPHLQPHSLVSLESTTWPGTTTEIVQPILEKLSKLTVGETLYLTFSPEREDPGNRSFTTKSIPKLVGADDEKSLELGRATYALAIDHVIALTSSRVAEAAKLFENVFRSVNIALVNEMKMILDKMGIDVFEVIEAAATKPFGFMPFFPGPGLGGHCIPIDPYYLTWKARGLGISTRFIELAGEINRQMPSYVLQKVQDCLNHFGKPLKGSKVLILGLSYKPDIDDMRESPSLALMRLLEEKGANTDYFDSYFPEIGKTREYQQFFGKKSKPPSSDYDCFLLATKHSFFNANELLSFGIPIVDTRNFLPKHPLVFPA